MKIRSRGCDISFFDDLDDRVRAHVDDVTEGRRDLVSFADAKLASVFTQEVKSGRFFNFIREDEQLFVRH